MKRINKKMVDPSPDWVWSRRTANLIAVSAFFYLITRGSWLYWIIAVPASYVTWYLAHVWLWSWVCKDSMRERIESLCLVNIPIACFICLIVIFGWHWVASALMSVIVAIVIYECIKKYRATHPMLPNRTICTFWHLKV